MITLICLGFVISLVVAFFGYKSELSNIIKLLALPLTIVYFGVAGFYYYENLGAPIERTPPLKVDYQHHTVEGDYILVWLYQEERGHRLYKIEYDRDTAKALEEAKKMKETGAKPKLSGAKGKGEKSRRVIWEVDNVIPLRELGEIK